MAARIPLGGGRALTGSGADLLPSLLEPLLLPPLLLLPVPLPLPPLLLVEPFAFEEEEVLIFY